MAKARTFVVVGVVLIGLGLWGVASTIPYKEPPEGAVVYDAYHGTNVLAWFLGWGLVLTGTGLLAWPPLESLRDRLTRQDRMPRWGPSVSAHLAIAGLALVVGAALFLSGFWLSLPQTKPLCWGCHGDLSCDFPPFCFEVKEPLPFVAGGGFAVAGVWLWVWGVATVRQHHDPPPPRPG